MKKMFSFLLFFGLLVLCSLEVFPKFYELATQGSDEVLFVAKTKKSMSTEMTNEVEKDDSGVDYQKMIQGINPDGA